VGYYTTEGPAGQVFEMLAGAAAPGEVAVLGLGAGSLACYAERGQRWTFFEIDPAVAALARTPAYFTYLSDSPTPSDLVIGDARLSLAAQSDKAYDLIVVDVFSSDAIPIHLLTREAFQVYADRLAPGGRILFHISNLYFRLRPVVSASARSVGLVAVARRHEADTDTAEGGVFPSEWMLVARRAEDFGALAFDQRWQPGDSSEPPWTDDHAPLVSAFIWKR
jgi:spermidine synthase